ncbi:hypothetical protein [Streptomyces sp. NPDC056061]|uniref:hypothetical protein n=1 Tax=Streptomyces sp. NPDC056061 TaxID=3345700 RepID=UPI0035D5B90B
MICPQCRGRLCPCRPDSYRCTGCRYEIAAEAWQLHQRLLAELDADEEGFFARVREHTARIRALEPAWWRG